MLELSFSENILLTTLSFFTALMTSLAGAGGGTVLLAAMLQFMNPASEDIFIKPPRTSGKD